MVLLVLRSGTKAPLRIQRDIPGFHNIPARDRLAPGTTSYRAPGWSDYCPGPGVIQVVGRSYCHAQRLSGGDE
jgi:hypothetical protein